MNTTTAQQSGPSDAAIAVKHGLFIYEIEYAPDDVWRGVRLDEVRKLIDKLTASDAEPVATLTRPHPPGAGVIPRANTPSGATTVVPNENALRLPPGEYQLYAARQLQAAGGEGDIASRLYNVLKAIDERGITQATWDNAKRVLADYESAPPAGGFVVVPRELTDAMREAWDKANDQSLIDNYGRGLTLDETWWVLMEARNG